MRFVGLSILSLFLVIASTSAAELTDELLPAPLAAATMQTPPGFHVELFAGEPDVRQPIGFCIDDRGRLWVAEAYNYPNHGTEPGDRIVILEDSDGDGRHDQRTVFYDKLNYVTGIEVGFGGVWVMSPPNFYFIPDADQDDVPDREPKVLLDGFGNHANAHNLANGFAWGPDGWLYGTHGRTNWSLIGKPGARDDQRQRFDGGVYRYHPTRHVWEPYADGTTNPWGIDWNDYGHAFVCNCVNPHLFQVIQGAHYEPWRGRKSSQYAYQRIDTIADHLHFVGISNVRQGLGSLAEDTAGGGHAHCGTMIYLGDSFPPAYRNQLFTNNIHGRRINNDLLRRNGSGYIASHGPDFLRSQDPWFMGVTLTYGPGGEVYASDWSDTGECHSVRNTRRETGRIYRVTYKDHTVPRVDLAEQTNEQLVGLQSHRNDWYVRHARRLLQERAAAGADMAAVHAELRKLLAESQRVPLRLRGLWALHATGGTNEPLLRELLSDPSEHIRCWAIQLLCEKGLPAEETLQKFAVLAVEDDSPVVRLYLASALQRLPYAERWEIAAALAGHGEDADDPNLPLMVWYGIEPMIDADVERFAGLLSASELSRVRINIARRIADSDDHARGLAAVMAELQAAENDRVRTDIVNGLLEGFEGLRGVPMPENWPAVFEELQYARGELGDRAVELALIFNDREAIQKLRAVVRDDSATAEQRRRAIGALVQRREPGIAEILHGLLDNRELANAAVAGLAAFDKEETAEALLNSYRGFDAETRQSALQTLASRQKWAVELVAALQAESIPATDLTAFTARLLRSLGNEEITRWLDESWGETRETAAERAKRIGELKEWLTADLLQTADTKNGQQLFKQHCAGCHKLFGEGGEVGPDLSGAQRDNLDYVLENIVDPSASVAKDYRMHIVQTDDGRVINGVLHSENDRNVTLLTATERIVVPKESIVARKMSEVSIMPDALLQPLSERQIRDLIGYFQNASASE